MTGEKNIKVIVAGLAEVGKSSIIRKIFYGFAPEDLADLAPTRGIEHTNVSFANDKKLVFWDLGGQSIYRYRFEKDPVIARQTRILIYVVDTQKPKEYELSYEYFKKLVELISEETSSIHISVFMHKVDPKMQKELRDQQFKLRKIFSQIQEYTQHEILFHSTTIFSDSLEFAFSKIVKRLEIDMHIYDEIKLSTGLFVGDKMDEKSEDIEEKDVNQSLQFLRNLIQIDQNMEDKSDNELTNIFNILHQNVIAIFENTVQQYHGDELLLHKWTNYKERLYSIVLKYWI